MSVSSGCLVFESADGTRALAELPDLGLRWDSASQVLNIGSQAFDMSTNASVPVSFSPPRRGKALSDEERVFTNRCGVEAVARLESIDLSYGPERQLMSQSFPQRRSDAAPETLCRVTEVTRPSLGLETPFMTRNGIGIHVDSRYPATCDEAASGGVTCTSFGRLEPVTFADTSGTRVVQPRVMETVQIDYQEGTATCRPVDGAYEAATGTPLPSLTLFHDQFRLSQAFDSDRYMGAEDIFEARSEISERGCPVITRGDGERFVLITSPTSVWSDAQGQIVSPQRAPISGDYTLTGRSARYQGHIVEFTELTPVCGTTQAFAPVLTRSTTLQARAELDADPEPASSYNDLGALRGCLAARYPDSYADITADWDDRRGFQINMKDGVDPVLCPTTLDVRVEPVDYSLQDLERVMNASSAYLGGELSRKRIDPEANRFELTITPESYARIRGTLDPFVADNPVVLKFSDSVVSYAKPLRIYDAEPVEQPVILPYDEVPAAMLRLSTVPWITKSVGYDRNTGRFQITVESEAKANELRQTLPDWFAEFGPAEFTYRPLIDIIAFPTPGPAPVQGAE